LDLFSGIGGLTLALSDWVRPVAYCEIERYASAVLLSRMSEGKLPIAPIWDNVTTLRGKDLPEIDIIYGGFPCQDISVAGLGKGLAGKRSGLFFEIMRLVDEVQPKFIFLENVPAITTRGLGEVTAEITKRGYDSRWTTLSAAEVGANHKRERWWLLAYSSSIGCNDRGDNRQGRHVQNVAIGESSQVQQERNERISRASEVCEVFPDSPSIRPQESRESQQPLSTKENQARETNWANSHSWWAIEPNVGRVANGIPNRVDRLKGLGNAVVPLQAREAFRILSGLIS